MDNSTCGNRTRLGKSRGSLFGGDLIATRGGEEEVLGEASGQRHLAELGHVDRSRADEFLESARVISRAVKMGL